MEIPSVISETLEVKNSDDDVLKLSPTDTILDANAASRVANMFLRQNSIMTKSATDKQIDSVIPYLGSKDHPLFYAVNFINNQGFILVSATRKFYPILAVVEQGHFDDNIMDSPVSIMLDEYERGISYYEKQPADSTKRFSSAWKNYIESVSAVPATTKLDGVDAIVVSQIQAWESAGYFVYPLSGGAPDSLPQSVYDSYVAIASGNDNPDFDYMQTSFILMERITSHEQTGPLISSHWHQRKPYNNSTPIKQDSTGTYVHCPTGCIPIALGQIMRYHQWPLSFTWSQMPDALPSNIATETTLSQFLYQIGSAALVDYQPDGTGSIDLVTWLDLLLFYDYSATLKFPHSASDAISSIQNLKPVYMSGCLSGQLVGHAWVADGYMGGGTYETYSLQTLSYPNLEFVGGGIPYTSYSGNGSLIHVNFGHGGTYDGWYSDSNIPYYTSLRCDIILSPDN
jgi:hypothetical protein